MNESGWDMQRRLDEEAKEMFGKKFDTDKLEWNLLYYPFLESVIRVMKLGKGRYGFENWKKPFDKTRLRNAMLRHAVADMKGEYIDPDSGEPHISHVVCNAMFLYYHELKEECKTLGDIYMDSLYNIPTAKRGVGKRGKDKKKRKMNYHSLRNLKGQFTGNKDRFWH